MKRSAKIVSLTLIGLAAVLWIAVVQPHRLEQSKRDLAGIVPEISTITLYDVDGFGPRDDKELASIFSAPFPADVFARAASSAECKGDPTIWKGSSLAVIKLRDGSFRRARFSYYGGFFTLHGHPGRFGVPGGSDSEFHQAVLRVIQRQFVPKRFERYRAHQP